MKGGLLPFLGINQSRFARGKKKERKVRKRLYFLPFRRNLFYKETATTVGLDQKLKEDLVTDFSNFPPSFGLPTKIDKIRVCEKIKEKIKALHDDADRIEQEFLYRAFSWSRTKNWNYNEWYVHVIEYISCLSFRILRIFNYI